MRFTIVSAHFYRYSVAKKISLSFLLHRVWSPQLMCSAYGLAEQSRTHKRKFVSLNPIISATCLCPWARYIISLAWSCLVGPSMKIVVFMAQAIYAVCITAIAVMGDVTIYCKVGVTALMNRCNSDDIRMTTMIMAIEAHGNCCSNDIRMGYYNYDIIITISQLRSWF